MIDNGNCDGPLGKKQHVFPVRRYVQELETFLTERERREDGEMVRIMRGEPEVHTKDEAAQWV
jgi:hypothetical protein